MSAKSNSRRGMPKIAAAALAAGMLFAATAQAAGSGMPWEEPLQQVLESVQGPVAKIVAVIIIITTGLTLAFGETAGGFRRLIQIVFGLSIAFAARSEEHKSELQSLMRISYAVFCLKKKKNNNKHIYDKIKVTIITTTIT